MSNLSRLEKWAVAIGFLGGIFGLISTGVNLYYDHYYGPDLEIKFFPYSLVQTNNVNQDIEINFSVFNKGNKTAFVDYIQIECFQDKNNIYFYHKYGETIQPEKLIISPGEAKEVKIVFNAPTIDYCTFLRISVNSFDDLDRIYSNIVPLCWGRLPIDYSTQLEDIKKEWEK